MSRDSDIPIQKRMERAKEVKAFRLAKAKEVSWPIEWTKLTEYHWLILLMGTKLEYWPSTGLWRWRGKNYRGSPQTLLEFIQKRMD